jgi:DNA polymerase-3 subunit epsilon
MLENLRLERPLAFLDLESTGTRPQSDRIVEVAVLRHAPDGGALSFHRRLDPGVPIPPAATAVHGLADADVADCLPFAAVADGLARFLGGCDLAGFGIKRFDLPLLVAEFRRAGVDFPVAGRAVLDALQIYHRRERRDLQAAVAFYCGRRHEQAHRASEDVRAAALILDAQLQRYHDLPRTVRELHRQFTEVDLAGCFRLEGGTPVFCLGRHTGRRLRDVARDDPGYLEWMLSSDFLDDVKELVRRAQG